MPNESLTIVLPAYSEEARLGSALDELFAYLRGPGREALTMSTRVLVAADGYARRGVPAAPAGGSG